ncbi:NfeD family protein [bacterium endosymbiont of Bathymodiolus sp. 5 South]|jgi:membrane protein implicated in regulation of membrane protease activity|uniref:NfeD family protein n=1 Tax=bacterium endosymbiont of Bathymodiolus sp. 5 South TaxID=1181670 RepID=UPI0010BAE7A2|nr:hypothetical protein [bacterium endosymbiont of Bathymodiolus sp. 5 South]SHN90283.1 hypothetical protein BCLUESOX_368 [bacterium endosymbiont of Bathymodiolus sp. 5 South]
MDSLSVTLLFSLGIFFTFLEVILYSFFIIWFGIAFLVVAIIEFFFPLPSIWVQLSLVVVIAVVLFLAFYKPLKSFVNKSQNFSNDFIKQHGKGIIKNNMLNYQGSYFKVVDCDISALDGTEVEVIKIDKNNAWIKNE